MSQLEAGDHGLVCTPQRGASRLLAWEELRLVEVFLEGSVRIYQVYGEKTSIAWRDPPLFALEWQDAKERFAERQQALLNLIVRRTGLVPRTFQKTLMAKAAAKAEKDGGPAALEEREELQPS